MSDAQACLATASARCCSPRGRAGAGQVIVNVWSFGFSPKPLHLAAGKTVTIQFVNQSGRSHDFTAPAFFSHARITAGAAPDGEIDLKGHETKSITLVPAAGSYEAHCSHFLHKTMGMSDLIVVD